MLCAVGKWLQTMYSSCVSLPSVLQLEVVLMSDDGQAMNFAWTRQGLAAAVQVAAALPAVL